MDRPLIENLLFTELKHEIVPLKLAEYDNCTFQNCNFAQANLTGMHFTACVFSNCDLSMATITQVAFREVQFENCKLLGWHFEDCNPFLMSLSCQDCSLDFSSFFRVKMKEAKFLNCNMQEVDFTEASLEKCDFSRSNLSRAVFLSTNLKEADFSTAKNFIIDPENNQLRGASFSAAGLLGLLHKHGVRLA